LIPSACLATAEEAVHDTGADATANATDAGGHKGQDDADEDHPDPPARPAFTLLPTGSNIVSTLLLATARSSPETLKKKHHHHPQAVYGYQLKEKTR
jgi:hypothetical protein